MKAGTQNHLKVKRLMRLLGVPMYRAVGILETLWLLCSDCCDEGDIGKYTDEEIADYLGWDGPQSASELVRHLSDSGWLDPDEGCRYIVHDWLEHCPEYIRDRVRKRQARGSKPRKQTTYVSPEPDSGGQSRTGPGVSGTCPGLSESVPSIPNPTQPNPTNSNPTNSIADKPRVSGKALVTIDSLEIPKHLNTPEGRSAIEEWLSYKRARNQPYKNPSHFANKLAEFSTAAGLVAAVKHSTGNNYDGLFLPKASNGQRTPGPGQKHSDDAPAREGIL